MRLIIDEEQRTQCHAGLEMQLDRLKKIKKQMEDAKTFSSRDVRSVQEQIDVIKGVDDDPGLLALFAKEGAPGEERHGKQGTMNLFDEMGGGDRSTHNAAVRDIQERELAEGETLQPASRFDREEGSLTAEQIAHGLAVGPWRDSWESVGGDGTEPLEYRHFAHVPASENMAERTDTETPRNEAEARARAAWLNLIESGTIERPAVESDELSETADIAESSSDDESEIFEEPESVDDAHFSPDTSELDYAEDSSDEALPLEDDDDHDLDLDDVPDVADLIVDPAAIVDPYEEAPKARRGKKA